MNICKSNAQRREMVTEQVNINPGTNGKCCCLITQHCQSPSTLHQLVTILQYSFLNLKYVRNTIEKDGSNC